MDFSTEYLSTNIDVFLFVLRVFKWNYVNIHLNTFDLVDTVQSILKAEFSCSFFHNRERVAQNFSKFVVDCWFLFLNINFGLLSTTCSTICQKLCCCSDFVD